MISISLSIVNFVHFQSNPASLEGEEFSIPDEMFHSFQLSTFDQEDSIVIELEDGLDLQDLDGDGKSILNVPDEDISESDTTKGNFNDLVSSKYVF